MHNHTKDINMRNHTKDINMHNHIEDEKLSQEIQEIDAPFFGPESHTMNVSVATQCKSAEAGLVFSHVFFWIKNNKIRGVNQINGRTWMYETIRHMQKFLPYLSEMQIKRTLAILVKHGYLLKANHNKNKFDHTSWYALPEEEWIDFKIISTKGQIRPIAQATATQGQGNAAPSYKDEDIKDRCKKEDMSDLAVGLSQFLFDQIKSINPKIKTPNFSKWDKEFDLMIKKDGHSAEDIQKVIKYFIELHFISSSNGFHWSNVIHSPESLRKHFAKIWGEMMSHKKINNDPRVDESLALTVKNKFLNRNDITLGYSYIEFNNGMTVEHIEFGDKKFKEKIIKELKRRNLEL